MENQNPAPDPYKYVYKSKLRLPSKSWLLFIAANIIIPVIFAAVYLNLTQNSQNEEKATQAPTPSPTSEPTQTPAPTPASDLNAGWKTYTNKENGYSIEYPSAIFVRLNCPGEELDLTTRKEGETREVIDEPACGRGGGAYYPIQINTVPGTIYGSGESDSFRDITSEPLTINGISGTKIISSAKEGVDGPPMTPFLEQVRFYHNNKTYIISLANKDLESTFYSILDTFKFTDSTED